MIAGKMSKSIYFLLFLLFFLVKSSECDKNKSDDRSLYENSTAIISAIPSSLKHLIYEKPWASLVFFYQNWCEKCIDQIDINLELGKELVYWQKVVKFVTINYDSQVGRDFNVSSSFEYRLAKPNTRSTHLIKFETNSPNTKESLVKSTLKALLKINKTNEEFELINWPKLNSLSDLKKVSSFSNKTLLFINKDSSIEESLIPLKIILDFSNYTDHLNILYCNESIFESSNYTKQHIKYPALYQFAKESQTFNLIDQGLTRDEFKNLTISKFLSNIWKPIEIDGKSRFKNETNIEKNFTNLVPVHFRDLNNALRKVFFSDFCRFKMLTAEQVQIMTNLSIVFREYFPYDNENTRRFLRRVSQFFKEQNQTASLKVDKVKATFKAGAEGFLQTEQPYISCKGSQPYLRGYPCSIWLLFHSLTVQEYLKFTDKNQTKKSNFTLPPNQVLHSMKGYILNFFPCTNCKKLFEQDSMNLENELVHLNSSILWLWNFHNKLNLLFKNKSNEDPTHPKQIYPPAANVTLGCKTCYSKEIQNSEKLNDLNDLEWNKTEVLNFLINQYRKESLVKSSAAILSNNLIYLIVYPIFVRIINRLI